MTRFLLVTCCCCGVLCRRRLDIVDADRGKIGIAESPCLCCTSRDQINIELPEKSLKMQVRRMMTSLRILISTVFADVVLLSVVKFVVCLFRD